MYKGTERSIPLVIIFSILTCGIYFLYWIYQTSNELRLFLNDDDINPTLDVVLSILCPGIYTIYWMYKTGRKQMDAQRKAGLPPTDDGILYLILAIFGFAIISQAIIQSKLNEIWKNA